MTLSDYITKRSDEGLSLTAAVGELAALLAVNTRTAWRWYEAGEAPPHVRRLLLIWAEATPEQRARWFK